MKNLPAAGSSPSQPAGEHPQKMPAGKDQHIAFDLAQTAHGAIGPRANLVRRFAVRAAVAEQLPVGVFRMNLRRSKALVIAVVPFDQIGIHFGDGPEAGQFAGAGRALQWTREDLRENQPRQPFPSRRALRSPRSVSGRSVRPVCWPVRLQAVSP